MAYGASTGISRCHSWHPMKHHSTLHCATLFPSCARFGAPFGTSVPLCAPFGAPFGISVPHGAALHLNGALNDSCVTHAGMRRENTILSEASSDEDGDEEPDWLLAMTAGEARKENKYVYINIYGASHTYLYIRAIEMNRWIDNCQSQGQTD